MATVETEVRPAAPQFAPFGTRFPEFFAMLAAPFEPLEVKERTQGGKAMRYVTARTVQNRLDAVCGPENWWPKFKPHENSVECELTLRLPDGTLVSKVDAGGYAGMADSGDDDKSGFSDGLKRAACMFGVARYLYRDGVPWFVAERTGLDGPALPLSEQAEHNTAAGAADPGPARPGAGAPSQARRESPREPDRAPPGGRREPRQGGGDGGPPRTGRACFAWVKDQEQRHEVGLLKYLNQWAKLQDFPGRMVDWSAEQVALAHAEATRKLASVGANGYEDEEALANGR